MSYVACIFSGQGAQVVGMGQSFYEKSPVVRQYFDQANQILDFDLKTACFEGPGEWLTQTRICQPALYVHGYALYAHLKSEGKLTQLKAAFGLSLGELTALGVAGVFDFETGLRIVAERGRLMQLACESTEGTMASILGASLEDVQNLCHEFDIDISNINSPGQIVISGETTRVQLAVEAGKNRGFKKIIPLNVAGAYHSRLMDSARLAFENFLKPIRFQAPQLAVYTNVDGQLVDSESVIKDRLALQIVSTVQWVACMQSAQLAQIGRFIECGPGGILAGLARRMDGTPCVVSAENIE